MHILGVPLLILIVTALGSGARSVAAVTRVGSTTVVLTSTLTVALFSPVHSKRKPRKPVTEGNRTFGKFYLSPKASALAPLLKAEERVYS